MWDGISKIADLFGIIGFFISLMVLVKFDKVKMEFEKQRISFIKTKEQILAQLKALKDNICEDRILTPSIVTNLLTELSSLKENYYHLLGKENMKIVENTIGIIKINNYKVLLEDDNTMKKILDNIAILIGILEKKGD